MAFIDPIPESIFEYYFYSVTKDRGIKMKFPSQPGNTILSFRVPIKNLKYGKIKQFKFACNSTKYNLELYSDINKEKSGINFTTFLYYYDIDRIILDSQLEVYSMNYDLPEQDTLYVDIYNNDINNTGELFLEIIIEDLDERGR